MVDKTEENQNLQVESHQEKPQAGKLTDQFETILEAFAGAKLTASDQLGQNLSQEALESARKNVAGIEDLRTEMMNDATAIVEMTEKLLTKIEANIKMNQNENGLLRHAKVDYEKFLSIDVAGFQNLLNKDVEIWKNGLEKTQNEAQKVADKVNEYLTQ